MNKQSIYDYTISGGVAGLISGVVTNPLEVIKIRLQALKNTHLLTAGRGDFRFGTGLILSFRDIIKSDGFKGLYRGLGPTLVGVIPSRAIWFTCYTFAKETLENTYGYNSLNHLFAGLFAGLSTTTITSPIWVVKTRLQIQTNQTQEYKNAFDCFRTMYRQEGFRSLFKGLSASYLGISESTIQIVLYEKLKNIVKTQIYYKENNIKSSSSDLTDIKKEINNIELNKWCFVVLPGISKLTASVITYPHEVLRTRLREQKTLINQTQKYTGLIQCMKLMIKEEGMRGLYKGLVPHLFKTVPNAIVLFFCYEILVKHFKRSN
eukprot:TRINITY_DN6413_c0_g1_i1.p1 TRINITY_DN6413_c0_g1~~TRINITY_DN6413_c0_g1_i1.p1  ORF type:complete len:320 (+),score=37.11 TRINITY_DN6413_c0_g1_i1:245-1204(+)